MASHGAIATVFDRANRYLLMAGLPDGRTAVQTLDAMTHQTLTDRCAIEIYFADPTRHGDGTRYTTVPTPARC